MYQKSDIQILIATMNRTNFDFLRTMFVFSDFSNFNLLVINQTTPDKLLQSDFENVEVINSFEKGLSKSRNLALKMATKKIIVLTDDDVVFQLGFEDFILNAFNSNIKHDGFRFQYENENGIFPKKYPKRFLQKLSHFEILNSSSVELVFKTESIKTKDLIFDENFGLGSTFYMGEEAVFVSDAIRKGLNIGFMPQTILLHADLSTGEKTSSSELYFVQSAVFYRIFGKMYLFWVALKLFFDLKQNKIKITQVYYLLTQALKGKKAYVNATKL
ncbi:glycosyltransferase family 2 protein [Flavobacterium sp.]|uniref:glycosyltransferase family 2 protein n=1 Tax=Flavobacterium sp. TaxID=239 RepID=UPI002FDDCF72